MKLLVGLGNPGEKYQDTRHNIGFMVLEHFLKHASPLKDTLWHDEPKFKSDIAMIDWQSKEGKLEKIILVRPKTFMNNSGMAIALIAKFYHIDADDIWVVYDDIDLNLGSFRIRFGGGAGGHRGVESVLEQVGNELFWRFRVGIGRPDGLGGVKGVDNYVLGNFGSSDHGKVREVIKRASDALEMALEKDLQTAMNRFNTK